MHNATLTYTIDEKNFRAVIKAQQDDALTGACEKERKKEKELERTQKC